MTNCVRIIGGKFRGKKIPFLPAPDLRPTPDRVKETLFNWLMNDIQDSRCLDAFAGSGALGFEAFSRGAHEVVFIEHNRIVYQHLTKMAAGFASDQLHIHHGDLRSCLQRIAKPFDIIFLDPPFAGKLLTEAVDLIVAHQLIKPEGLVYIESPEPWCYNPQQWIQLKAKKAGQVAFGLYKKIAWEKP